MAQIDFAMLDQFEADWVPDPDYVASWLERNSDADSDTLTEILRIDMELGWRRGTERFMYQPCYERALAGFTRERIVRLIAWEFRVRSEWGDCVQQFDICQRHEDLGDTLRRSIEQVSTEIDWPMVLAHRNHGEPLRLRLDREVHAGRRRNRDAPPVETNLKRHRLNLSEFSDISLSRSQFSLRLLRPSEIEISNTSRNRAFAIENIGVVEPGELSVQPLPAMLVLGEDRMVEIRPVAGGCQTEFALVVRNSLDCVSARMLRLGSRG